MFVSNDSGRLEAYVQAFEAGERPQLTGERLRILTEGAQLVRWRGDGKEICYLRTDGFVYSSQRTAAAFCFRPCGSR